MQEGPASPAPGGDNASVPEPPPQPHGVVVPDALCQYLQTRKPWRWEALLQLVLERDAFGRKKYGQPLMSEDGRNGFEDARQELGDLLQYTYKMYLAGDSKGLRELDQLARGYLDTVFELRELLRESSGEPPELVDFSK
jgi:hypothetical protein